jgi:hypothetical protein
MSEDKVQAFRSEKNRQREDRKINDLKAVLKTPEGRRFIWNILSEAGIYQSSFTGNSETFFREGKRALGLMIVRDIDQHMPEAMAQMSREYYSEIKSDQAQEEAIRKGGQDNG